MSVINMDEKVDEPIDDVPHSLGLSNLVALIEFEINQIHQKARSAGFNFWIIIAAEAACVWALFSVYDTQMVEREVTYRIVLFAVFLSTAVVMISLGCRLAIPRLDSAKPRFIAPQTITVTSSRASIFCLSVAVLIAYLVNRVGGSSLLYSTPAYVSAGFFVLQASFFIIAPRLSIPLPDKASDQVFLPQRKRALALIVLLYFILFAYLSVDTLLQLVGLSLPITLNDLRASLLMLAIIYLYFLLCRTNMHGQTLQQLTEIRRNLILESLPVRTAGNQVKISLMGITMADHLLPAHAEFLNCLQRYDKEMAYAEKEIHAFTNISVTKTNDPTAQVTVVALVNSITQHLLNAAKIMLDGVLASYVSLRKKLLFMGNFYSVDSETIQSVRKLSQDKNGRMDKFNLTVFDLFKEIESTMGVRAASNFISELNRVDGIHFDPGTGELGES